MAQKRIFNHVIKIIERAVVYGLIGKKNQRFFYDEAHFELQLDGVFYLMMHCNKIFIA